MRKFFGKFVSVTLAAAVIAMFALSSDDKWCSRVDKAFDESVLGSFLNESKAGYGRYATGLPGQAASVLADSGENGENGENGGNGGNGGTEQDIGQTADTASTHRATDRDYEETDKISAGISVEGVYACGRLTGIYEQTEGVLVVNTTEVTDEDGKKVNPADKKVQCGDYILSVNGRTVADKEELSEAVNDIMKQHDESHEDKSTVNIKFLRGGEKMSADITPVRMDDGKYYMGIWVKDDLAGIGTLTYISQDGSYGALGHAVTDMDTGSMLEVGTGKLYNSRLVGIVKGESGKPGELSGVINYEEKYCMGDIEENCERGIYGTLHEKNNLLENAVAYPVGYKQDIEPGEAEIISDIDGTIAHYKIRITEVNYRKNKENKSILFEVEDAALLESTGGIVQGMSGSPVIQNGRLIGAVTHVFVDDAKKGYGIFIEDMLEIEKTSNP